MFLLRKITITVDISIHALLAESDGKIDTRGSVKMISIHALLAESDVPWSAWLASRFNFYPRSPCGERRITIITISTASKFLSTLSLRRATLNRPPPLTSRAISIHALLAESDWLQCWQLAARDISIHALLAESDTWARGSRATYVISIHALLAESDMRQRLIEFRKLLFLSTLSLRRATHQE